MDGEPRLEISYWGSEGEFVNLTVSASNKSFSGSIGIYCRRAGLVEFANEKPEGNLIRTTRCD